MGGGRGGTCGSEKAEDSTPGGGRYGGSWKSLWMDPQPSSRMERPCGESGGTMTQACGRVRRLLAGQLLRGNGRRHGEGCGWGS